MRSCNPEKVFLGWDMPLVELAAAKFAESWDPRKGPLDLERCLVLVSASGASRELRTELAMMASGRKSYVIPPRILTAEPFLLSFQEKSKVASETEILSAWSKVLLGMEPKRYSALFPVSSARKDFPWALSTAELLAGLRRVLGENGLSISDVSRNSNLDEPERWSELALLEEEYLAVLRGSGVEDPEYAKKAHVSDMEPKEFDRIIIVGMPDPLPLMIEKLQKLGTATPVSVWINAPVGMKDFFDEWGRTVPDKWSKVNLDVEMEDLVCAFTKEDQADKVIQQIASFGNEVDVSDLAVTAVNQNLFQSIKEKLEEHASLQGQEFHVGDPAGTSVKKTCLYNIVTALASFLSDKEFRHAESLARIPEALRHLTGCGMEECADYIAALDEFKITCIPFSFDQAKKLQESFAGASRSERNVELVANYIRSLEVLVRDYKKAKSIPDFVRQFLAQVFRERSLDPVGSADDSEFMEAGKALEQILESFDTEASRAMEISKDGQLALLTRLFEKCHIYPEAHGEVMEISGWLELPWKKASKVILAGMNEGYAPDSITGDVFLPNSMRTRLGLRDNEGRFARDLFIFASIINSREKNGNVRIIVGRQDFDEKPIKPSRILFMCSEDAFVKRVEKLFRETQMRPPPEPANSEPAWKLKPDWKSGPLLKISVTAFKDYLECPFRFYLKHVARMHEEQYEKMEMDPMEFGNICHDALRELHACESSDAKLISEAICGKASELLRKRYGDDLPVPLLIQEYSLLQRLGKAAEAEAEQRGLGWKIIDVEYAFGNKKGIEIGGMCVTGKIDRIDYNAGLKKVRILDYKTSETGKDPKKIHYKRGEWVDLQLPLYRILFDMDGFLREKIGGGFDSVECGYFNMPKAVSTTKILIWEDLDSLRDSAEDKVKEIISGIRNGVFWPPAEQVENEISGWMFPYETTKCVDPGSGGGKSR